MFYKQILLPLTIASSLLFTISGKGVELSDGILHRSKRQLLWPNSTVFQVCFFSIKGLNSKKFLSRMFRDYSYFEGKNARLREAFRRFSFHLFELSSLYTCSNYDCFVVTLSCTETRRFNYY